MVPCLNNPFHFVLYLYWTSASNVVICTIITQFIPTFTPIHHGFIANISMCKMKWHYLRFTFILCSPIVIAWCKIAEQFTPNVKSSICTRKSKSTQSFISSHQRTAIWAVQLIFSDWIDDRRKYICTCMQVKWMFQQQNSNGFKPSLSAGMKNAPDLLEDHCWLDASRQNDNLFFFLFQFRLTTKIILKIIKFLL